MNPATDRYDSLFAAYAEFSRDRNGAFARRGKPLDWTLLKRQAHAESNFDPDALSPVGAEGLSQFMTATWQDWVAGKFGKAGPPPRKHVSPFDPEDAAWAQSDMMAWLLDFFGGDVRKALAGYNWGSGNVHKAVADHGDSWETALPKETHDYLAKILGGTT